MSSSRSRPISSAAVLLIVWLGGGGLPQAVAAPSTDADLYVAPPGTVAATAAGASPDGSRDRPFRELGAALAEAGPGATVHLHGGRYEHSGAAPAVTRGGTAEAPLTIRAVEGEQPVMVDGCLDVFADHTTVQGVECAGDSGPGIMVQASHVKILDNVVHGTEGAGIPVYAETLAAYTDVLIQGNTVYDTARSNIGRTATGGWPFAVGALGADDVRIKDNVVFRNYGEGINCGGVDGCQIADNTLYDNFSVNLYVDNSLDTDVLRNFSYSTGDENYFRDGRPAAGIQLANEDSAGEAWEGRRLEGVVVRNNIVSGTGDCFHYGGYEAGGGMKDTLVAHNTFHGCTLGALFIGPGDGHAGTRVTQNVFAQTGGAPLTRIDERADLTGITFSRNLFSGGDPGRAAGTGDVAAGPQLVDPGSLAPAGFRIASPSPARDAGVPVPEVARDFFGTERDNQPDLGAHEVDN